MLLWLIWRSPNFFDHLEKEWEELARVYLFKGCREKGHGTGHFHVQDLQNIYLFIVVLRCNPLFWPKQAIALIGAPSLKKIATSMKLQTFADIGYKTDIKSGYNCMVCVYIMILPVAQPNKASLQQKNSHGFLSMFGHKQNCFCPSESTFYTMAVYKYSTSNVVLTICSFVVACFYKNHVQLVPRHPLRLATRDA